MNSQKNSLRVVGLVMVFSVQACGTPSDSGLSTPVEPIPVTIAAASPTTLASSTPEVSQSEVEGPSKATSWSSSAVAAAQLASGGLRRGADCDSGTNKEPPTGELEFTTLRVVGRMYGEACLVIAWGLAVNPNTSPDLDLPAAALEAVEEVRRTGLAPLLLFDDTGNYLGSEIGAVADPPEAKTLAG